MVKIHALHFAAIDAGEKDNDAELTAAGGILLRARWEEREKEGVPLGKGDGGGQCGRNMGGKYFLTKEFNAPFTGHCRSDFGAAAPLCRGRRSEQR